MVERVKKTAAKGQQFFIAAKGQQFFIAAKGQQFFYFRQRTAVFL